MIIWPRKKRIPLLWRKVPPQLKEMHLAHLPMKTSQARTKVFRPSRVGWSCGIPGAYVNHNVLIPLLSHAGYL